MLDGLIVLITERAARRMGQSPQANRSAVQQRLREANHRNTLHRSGAQGFQMRLASSNVVDPMKKHLYAEEAE